MIFSFLNSSCPALFDSVLSLANIISNKVKRFLLLLLGIGTGVCSSSLALGPPSNSVDILLVVTSYQGTEAPLFTSEYWTQELNLKVNQHYDKATQGQAPQFNFIPVPGYVEFDYTYESTIYAGYGERPLYNDQERLERDGLNGIIYAKEQLPEYFEFPKKPTVIVIVNREKRGVANTKQIYHSPKSIAAGIPFEVAISLMSQPMAAQLPFAEPDDLLVTSSDSDGDGLEDSLEVVIQTNPGNWDTDGDGLSDGLEFNELGTGATQEDSDNDGFSDGLEYNLETSDPLDSSSLPQLPFDVMSTMIHELGHLLGLPDLYADRRYFEDEQFASWGTMGHDRIQNFSAFSRSEMKWHLPGFGERVFDIGVPGLEPTRIQLIEPERHLESEVQDGDRISILRIRRRPALDDLLFEAPMLEVVPHLGLDDAVPGEPFINSF